MNSPDISPKLISFPTQPATVAHGRKAEFISRIIKYVPTATKTFAVPSGTDVSVSSAAKNLGLDVLEIDAASFGNGSVADVLYVTTNGSKRHVALMNVSKTFLHAKGFRRIVVTCPSSSVVTPFEIVRTAEMYYGTLVAWEDAAETCKATARDAIKKKGKTILVFDRWDGSTSSTVIPFVKRIPVEVPEQIRFIDLFAGGIGAYHLAGKRVGAECVFASELMPQARLNYQANHGLLPAGDITKVANGEIPEHEILCAGFCCQPWSMCGQEKGFIDPRGLLFFEIIRITKALRPPVLFLENVDNLARKKNRRALQAICDALEGAGYDVHYQVLNSSYFGAATARRRIYFVCFDKKLGVTNFEFPAPTCEMASVKDFLLPDSETDEYVASESELATFRPVTPKPKPCPLGKADRCPHGKGNDCPLRTVRIGLVRDGSQGDRVYDGDFHTTTIVTGYSVDLHRINGRIRRLAPREMASVMGLPKDFVLPKNAYAAQKYIGNSMAVPVVEKIFAKIISTLRSKSYIVAQKAA